MTNMNNSKNDDDQNDYAIIHVRPGLEGKGHPIGTIAVSLPLARVGTLAVGYAIQHSKLDRWDAVRGRKVAVGRAARGRDSVVSAIIDKGMLRRELLITALGLLVAEGDILNLSHSFRRATKDTLQRMIAAKEADDVKRAAKDQVSEGGVGNA